MTKILILYLAIIIGTFNYTKCVEITDCGSDTGKVTAMNVTGCTASSDVCIFKAGTNVSLDAEFLSGTQSNNPNVRVWGIIAGIPIPFMIRPNDACNWGVKCPITNGGNYQLKLTIPVLRQYPPIGVTVRIALYDERRNTIMCKQFPVRIVHN